MRWHHFTLLLASSTAVLLLGTACQEDPAGPGTFSITRTVTQLPPLLAGQGHYEAWISFPQIRKALGRATHGDESYVSIGRFNLRPNDGALVNLNGQPQSFAPAQEVDINLAIDALITVEQEGDRDSVPGARLMGGIFTGSERKAVATLSPEVEDALGFDYALASGVCVLATPTTFDPLDFRNGIWWLRPGEVPAAAGLQNPPSLGGQCGLEV